jgi:hypothetical protein
MLSIIHDKDVVIWDKESTLEEAQRILEDAQNKLCEHEENLSLLRQKLQEELWAKEALKLQWEQAMKEAELPWWKKLFRIYSRV